MSFDKSSFNPVSTKPEYKPFTSYGIIGNCRSCALVSDEASIDWACLPNFDSPAQFLKILDNKLGGFFQINPIGLFKTTQKYLENTNVLQTIFFNHAGTATVEDLMPITVADEKKNNIDEFGTKFVRLIKAVQGNHTFELKLKVTPNYASKKASITNTNGLVTLKSENFKLVLYKKHHKVLIRQGVIYIKFKLKEGEQEFFGLDFMPEDQNPGHLTKQEVNRKLSGYYHQTIHYWRWWSEKCTYKGSYYSQVIRSALTLKLLTFLPTGAIVAAPTTSLPEKLGANLNWDYRFTWLRDASFTVYAFLGLGFLKEAESFINWLENVCIKEGSVLKIMYGIHGEKELSEVELKHLSGYQNSQPVRIGNGAANQKQFDIFGEVLTAINLYVEAGGTVSGPIKDFIKKLVDYCCIHWREPDAGIWEARHGDKHNTYSKLMCWVGIDRGLILAEKLKISSVDFSFWQYNKKLIKEDILKNGFNKKIKSFTLYYGCDKLDASTLNIPILGLLPPDDPMVTSTLDQIMKNLVIDWFVLRTNDSENKLQEGEGTFFLPTFWVVDVLSFLGKTEEAKIWLDKIIQNATPLGLYAEEFDPLTISHLGNFPQAFTHLGLINSILNLEQAQKFGADKKATQPNQRLKRFIERFFIS